jgi:hypothetical protein
MARTPMSLYELKSQFLSKELPRHVSPKIPYLHLPPSPFPKLLLSNDGAIVGSVNYGLMHCGRLGKGVTPRFEMGLQRKQKRASFFLFQIRFSANNN